MDCHSGERPAAMTKRSKIDNTGRTRWRTLRQHGYPFHHGEYECAVRITSAQRGLFVWKLRFDGKGFLVPLPMIVVQWRGLTRKAYLSALKGQQP